MVEKDALLITHENQLTIGKYILKTYIETTQKQYDGSGETVLKKSLLTLTTVAVVGLSSAVFGDVAHAENVTDLEEKQTDIEQKREDIKKDLSKADAEIADILIDLEELKSEIKELEEAQEKNNLVLDETEDTIKEHEDEITELEEEIDELEASIEKRDNILKDRISSYQQNGGNISFIDVLFGSDDFGDFISRISAVTKITTSDQQLMEDLEEDKDKVIVVQEEVEEKLSEQEELKEDLQEMVAVIEGQKETKEENEKSLKKQEKKLTKTVAKLETEDSDLSSLEAQVSRELSEARNPVVASSNDESSSSNNEGSSNNGGDTSTLSEEQPKNVPAASGGSSNAIDAAHSQLGIQNTYVWGGKSPSTGFDCSGFVSWAYGESGQSIPSTTSDLSGVGTKIPFSEAQPGDLVFFDTYKADGHVAIYLGNGNFIGSQSSTGVGIANLQTNSYWSGAFKGHVRRVN